MNINKDYIQIFDSTNVYYHRDLNYNLMLLKSHQQYFNDALKNKGYVFLRDVYEALGFPITKASLLTGWVYDKNKRSQFSDGFIDFGIKVIDSDTISLDFNVDGNITNFFDDEIES